MRAIVGLGNPGRKYQKTRHNIGFVIIDSLLDNYKIPLKAGKGDYYYSEIEIAGERILLVKPTTYMNMSGVAIRQMIKYYPISIQDILVVYDDFHLPFGTLRFRAKGSDGGHNGIRSIIIELGTDIFARLRFGIGNEFLDAVKFVLSKFSKKERDELAIIINSSAQGIIYWIENGLEEAMNKYNQAYI